MPTTIEEQAAVAKSVAGLVDITTQHAAAIAGVSSQTIINWCNTNKIVHTRIGKGPRRILQSSFKKFLLINNIKIPGYNTGGDVSDMLVIKGPDLNKLTEEMSVVILKQIAVIFNRKSDTAVNRTKSIIAMLNNLNL